VLGERLRDGERMRDRREDEVWREVERRRAITWRLPFSGVGWKA
jgi:hypothetical protein